MMLTEQDIHNIGMNHVGKELQSMGFEFLGVNSELKKNPQFVTYKKNHTMNFVVVKTSIFPANKTDLFNQELINKLSQHAQEKCANLWFALVEIKTENPTEQIRKTDDIWIDFKGFDVIYEVPKLQF